MTALILLNSVWGVLCWKKTQFPLRFVLSQVFAAISFEIAGQILRLTGHYTAMLFNFYILLEFILLIVVIPLLVKTKVIKPLVIVFISMYVVFWGKTMMANGVKDFATNVFLLGCLLLSCSYFYLIIKISSSQDGFVKQPVFWISLGITIYFCSVIPLFGMFHYFEVHNKRQLGAYLYTINDIMGIVRYSLIFYGLYLLKKGNTYTNER